MTPVRLEPAAPRSRVKHSTTEPLRSRIVVDFLSIVTPIVGVCYCSMFCCTLLYVHSSIAIILIGKRKLVVLLNLSSWCPVMVERLFLVVPQGCLRFVIVVFPDHTHYLFLNRFLLLKLLTLRHTLTNE